MDVNTVHLADLLLYNNTLCLWYTTSKCVWERSTHPSDVSRSELYRAEQAQDDDDDVQEVGQDGSPLVTQEIYDLTLQNADLRGRERREEEISGQHINW